MLQDVRAMAARFPQAVAYMSHPRDRGYVQNIVCGGARRSNKPVLVSKLVLLATRLLLGTLYISHRRFNAFLAGNRVSRFGTRV